MHLKCSMELGVAAQTSNPRTLWMTTVKDHFDPFGKCVCATLMCLGPSEVRRVICFPENGVKRAENCHVVAEKWTWVFYKEMKLLLLYLYHWRIMYHHIDNIIYLHTLYITNSHKVYLNTSSDYLITSESISVSRIQRKWNKYPFHLFGMAYTTFGISWAFYFGSLSYSSLNYFLLFSVI